MNMLLRLLASLIVLVTVPSSNPTVLASQQAPGRAPRLSNEGGGSGAAVAATWAHVSLEGMGLTAELPSDAEQLELGSMPEAQLYLGNGARVFAGLGWTLVVVRATFDSRVTSKVLKDFGSGVVAGLGSGPDVTDFKCSLQPERADRIRISGSFKRQSVALSVDAYVFSMGRDAFCAAAIYENADPQARATALRVVKSISPER
jgi:hypothetical protein